MVLKDTLEHSKALLSLPRRKQTALFLQLELNKRTELCFKSMKSQLGGYYSKGIVMGNTARVPLEIPYISPNI